MDQVTLIKLQQNSLSYPYPFVYQREVKATSPQVIIERANSFVEKPTERNIFTNFLKKSINILDSAISDIDKKYPDMLKV